MSVRRALLRAGIVAVALAAAAVVPAHACEACANPNVKSPMIDGARVGVALMLAVTVLVQGGFAAFFLHLRNHAKRHQERAIDAEWAVLQRSSQTS